MHGTWVYEHVRAIEIRLHKRARLKAYNIVVVVVDVVFAAGVPLLLSTQANTRAERYAYMDSMYAYLDIE